MTDTEVPPIRTERMALVSLSVPYMEALARGDVEAAARDIGAFVPDWVPVEMGNFLRFRLAQLRSDPTIREWLGRSMVVTASDGSRRVIGTVGFHGPPNAEGKAEVGYRVDPDFRRQGYAREAIRALFDWAYSQHGVTTFIASISPDNQPSLSLAREFGFEKVGQQMDEIDGLELVFETRWPPAEGR